MSVDVDRLMRKSGLSVEELAWILNARPRDVLGYLSGHSIPHRHHDALVATQRVVVGAMAHGLKDPKDIHDHLFLGGSDSIATSLRRSVRQDQVLQVRTITAAQQLGA